MRDIMFRGVPTWEDLNDPKIEEVGFVYGLLMRAKDKFYIVDTPLICDDGYAVFNICVQVHPETVGQYIGVQDSYDWDVYEGDIMRWHINGFTGIGKVVYDSGKFDLRDEYGSIKWDSLQGEYTVIGNIYKGGK